jgi:hypothetical protein
MRMLNTWDGHQSYMWNLTCSDTTPDKIRFREDGGLVSFIKVLDLRPYIEDNMIIWIVDSAKDEVEWLHQR